MGDHYHNLIAVAIITAVGYDYGELWFCSNITMHQLLYLSVLTFSNEVL